MTKKPIFEDIKTSKLLSFLQQFFGVRCVISPNRKMERKKKTQKAKDRFKENLFQFKVQARNTRRNKLKIMFVKNHV